MDDNIVEEKKCPICNDNIRPDANVHEFCKFCGMEIPEPLEAPKIQTENKTEYFCCDLCFKIYKDKIKYSV